MLENVYEGLNAWPKVYLSKEYFCEMYPTCVRYLGVFPKFPRTYSLQFTEDPLLMQADLDTVLHVSLFSSIIIFRNGDFLDFSTFPRTLFLAVQNSSIGDLVTHSLTDWLTNSLTFTFAVQRTILETCYHWDIWSEWWGDMTWLKIFRKFKKFQKIWKIFWKSEHFSKIWTFFKNLNIFQKSENFLKI